MVTKVHPRPSEGAQVVRGTMTQELESQGQTQPGKHQCNAVGPGEQQAEGMRRSDQAFQWTRRGRDSHPACPRLLTPSFPNVLGAPGPGLSLQVALHTWPWC